MKKRIARGLGAVAISALLLSGCGGGDEEPLSKAEFIEQGNAICKEGVDERKAVRAEEEEKLRGKKVTQQKLEESVANIFEPYVRMTEELAELSLPERNAQQAEAVVGAMEKAVSEIKANPTALLRSERPVRKANELATSYGLVYCIY